MGSLWHPIKFKHIAKYIKAESLWWFLAYQIPFLIIQILYRLTEEHKNVEVTIKTKLSGVPMFMSTQTLKIQ